MSIKLFFSSMTFVCLLVFFSRLQTYVIENNVCWLTARGAVSTLYSFMKHGHDWCVYFPV